MYDIYDCHAGASFILKETIFINKIKNVRSSNKDCIESRIHQLSLFI
jgi:hypothetical protein